MSNYEYLWLAMFVAVMFSIVIGPDLFRFFKVGT